MATHAPQSYNSRVKSSLRQFLVPGAADIALYLFISLMALLLLNARSIWDYFSSQNLAGVNLGELIGQNPHVHNFLTRISQGRILQGIFWGLVGIIMYFLIWSIRNIFVNLRNDIVADEYVHPAAYNRKRYWWMIINRKFLLVLSIGVLIAYIYACVSLVPLFARNCKNAVENYTWSVALLELLGAWLSVGFLIYILVLLLRIVIIGWKVVYTDL